MKTRILAIYLTLATISLTTSCQSKKTEENKVTPSTTQTVDFRKVKDEIVKIVKTMPTNSETVDLINSTGTAYLIGFTGSNLKIESLLTRADKAKAYGTVIFDLAYTHTYNELETFSKLVKIYESLTRDLGFEELVQSQKQFRDRYQNNKENKDSINFLVTDMLNKTNNFIQKNGSAVDISLVVGGAVLKSLNVISYLTLFASDKDKLMVILKKQKEVINAACDILKKTSADQDVNKLYQALLPISSLFNSPETFTVKTVEQISKLTDFISEKKS